MTEFLTSLAAVLVLFLSAQTGARSGAFAALSWMLASLLSLLIALRYWFVLCRAAASYTTVSLPILAAFCFWLLFLLTLFAFVRLRETYIEEFEAVAPSLPGRALGALFGAVSGAVFASGLIMTFSLLAPQYFAAEKPTLLPIALEAMPTVAFRSVEAALAGVNANDPAHTRLPKARNAEQQPMIFWQ